MSVLGLIKFLSSFLGVKPPAVGDVTYYHDDSVFNKSIIICGDSMTSGAALTLGEAAICGDTFFLLNPFSLTPYPPNIFGTGGIITGWSGDFVTGIDMTLGFSLTEGTSTQIGVADISYAALGDYANALKSEILPETFTITPDDSKTAFSGDLTGGWKINGLPVSGEPDLTSDIRLKKNIESFSNGLEIVLQLNPVRFDWREDLCPDSFLNEYREPDDEDGYPGQIKRQYGLIAQEVEEIAPDVVGERKMYDETYKLIRYEKLVPVLISAIQDQQKQIEDLKNEISLLKDNNK